MTCTAQQSGNFLSCKISQLGNSTFIQANSNSIFFPAVSSFTIRNWRISPARAASGLALSTEPPVFHLACSIEPKDDRSALAGEELTVTASGLPVDPAFI